MAHQFPNQLLDRGEHGRRLYNSIMENASSKVVFRLTHEENLRVMAQWLYMGVMDPDEVKHELHSTKVMEYREELRTTASRMRGYSVGGGKFKGLTETGSIAGRITDGTVEDPDLWNDSIAESSGDSDTWTASESEGESVSSILIPVMGKELSHVQFRSLDEQIFRAMAVLFDQRERFCVARTVGMSTPAALRVPDLPDLPSLPERARKYLARCYEKLPFALPQAQAHKQIEARAETFKDMLLNESAPEPVTARRRTR
jgi:hypothetical protein